MSEECYCHDDEVAWDNWDDFIDDVNNSGYEREEGESISFWVGPKQTYTLAQFFNWDEDCLYEAMYDEVGEIAENYEENLKAVEKELLPLIKQTIESWAKDRKMSPNFWTVGFLKQKTMVLTNGDWVIQKEKS